MTFDKPLEGQIAIVTGGGRGIGRGIATVLAGRGASVVVTARSRGQISETEKIIRDAGGSACAIAADVTDEKDVANLVAETVKQFGKIDILVNNAGSFCWIGPLWEAETERWWRDVTVNLKGVYLCCRHVIPEMIKQGEGVIINLSGGGASSYLLYGSSYASSKAAVLRLTENCARELKDQGHENIVMYASGPGLVYTEMTRYQAESPEGQKYIPGTKEFFDKDDKEVVRKPEECGYVCAWLAEHRPAEFSGRSFGVGDDFDKLLSQKEQIIKQDLRFLRGK